jgi:hypothetical protein
LRMLVYSMLDHLVVILNKYENFIKKVLNDLLLITTA